MGWAGTLAGCSSKTGFTYNAPLSLPDRKNGSGRHVCCGWLPMGTESFTPLPQPPVQPAMAAACQGVSIVGDTYNSYRLRRKSGMYWTVGDFWGGDVPTMASALHTAGKKGWAGGGGRGVKLSVPMGSHWLHIQRSSHSTNCVYLYRHTAFLFTPTFTPRLSAPTDKNRRCQK